MTPNEFRKMALSMPDAVESAHMNHPDFRVGQKIFATLSANEEHGVLLLSPVEQQRFMAAQPAAYSPASGSWGRNGSTKVHLESIDAALLREAMTAAWRRKAPAKLRGKSGA